MTLIHDYNYNITLTSAEFYKSHLLTNFRDNYNYQIKLPLRIQIFSCNNTDNDKIESYKANIITYYKNSKYLLANFIIAIHKSFNSVKYNWMPSNQNHIYAATSVLVLCDDMKPKYKEYAENNCIFVITCCKNKNVNNIVEYIVNSLLFNTYEIHNSNKKRQRDNIFYEINIC